MEKVLGKNQIKQYLLVFFMAITSTLSVPGLANEPAPKQSTANFEIRFLEGMIDHHAMAVQMAQLCEQKAIHEELKSLCTSIKITQRREIEEMQSWLSDWYGIHHEPAMSKGMMQQMERLSSLSAAEFEIEFMKRMIRHHWQAIVEASQCVDRAFHNELESLCKNIIVTQAAEIKQMRAWLCEWYNVCHYGGKGREQGK